MLAWVVVAFVFLTGAATLDGGRFRWSQPPVWTELAVSAERARHRLNPAVW